MDGYFAGLDVSQNETAVRVRCAEGAVAFTRKVETDPDAICAALATLDGGLSRVILETGRMANRRHDELARRGLPVVCVDARQAHAVLGRMRNSEAEKRMIQRLIRPPSDANDAAMPAELARTGFYLEARVKSREAQERRASPAARDEATGARRNAENTIRGLLASFGIRLPAQPRTYEGRVRAALDGREALARILLPLLAVRTEALRQAAALTKELVRQTRSCEACNRLMTIPGVGTITAAIFVAAIDAPGRFGRSRSVGAYAGLTSRRHQSGAVDCSGRISKRGDRMLRTILHEAANSLLRRVRPGRGQRPKNRAMTVKKRAGHRSAVVALARKLAVMMHAIWISGAVFEEARM